MNKLVYKPVGMLAGAVAGAVAGLLFKEIWKRAAGEEDA